eukprot:202753_1
MGHLARDFSHRYLSSRLNAPRNYHGARQLHKKRLSTTSVPAPLPLTNPAVSFLQDLESEFFPKSFFDIPTAMSMSMPFFKQMEWLNDTRNRTYFPQTHVKKEADKHTLSMEVPGVTIDDINVEIKDDRVLHISGEKKSLIETDTEDGTDTKKSEIKFEKNFSFGDTVDTKNIVANLKDGILRVTLPQLPKSKLPAEKVRQLQIGTEATHPGLE